MTLPNLTKRKIVQVISAATGRNQAVVADVVGRILREIIEAVATGRNVELRDFGTFEVRLGAPRVGRNPAVPGSRYEIPTRWNVRFRPAKHLTQKVRPGNSAPAQSGKAIANSPVPSAESQEPNARPIVATS